MVAIPALKAQAHPDARVFALIGEHEDAERLIEAAENRWSEAVDEALPPRLRDIELRTMSREDRDLLWGVVDRPNVKALSAKTRRAEDGCRAVVRRLAETPAQTLEGIHAKFQDAIRKGYQGRRLDDNIALSAVDDLARLVGEG